MKHIFLAFILLALSSCAPALHATATLQTTVTFTPPPTETPLPSPTATPTPIVFDIEQLGAMTNEQKLSVAPQPETAPDDVVSSFLPNQTAKDITWGEKSLSFWDRVVTYQGTTKTGESVTLYYDLESGQWAKKYADYLQVSQIPEDQIPDIMFVGDRLIRNKLEYPYDWISQPQVMTKDGKMIFRDDKGYPKAVWDTINHKWMTPEEAAVPWTFEKYKEIYNVPYIGDTGLERNHQLFFNSNRTDFITKDNIDMINNLPTGIFIMVFNPSGEIDYFISKEEAIARVKEGAFAAVGKGESLIDRNEKIIFGDWQAWEVAFNEYKKSNKNIFVVFGDIGVKSSEIHEMHLTGNGAYKIEEIPQIIDPVTGRIVCPVIRVPRHFGAVFLDDRPSITQVSDADFWLDELIKAGVQKIGFDAFDVN